MSYTLKVVPIIEETLNKAKYFVCVVNHQALSNLPVARPARIHSRHKNKIKFQIKIRSYQLGYI